MLKFLKKINWFAVIFTVINSIVLAVFFDLSPTLRLIPEVNVTYQDLAATLLSAVGIIIAVFGAVLGVLGLRGYNNIREEAVKNAEEHIKKSLLDGGCLHELVKKETIEQARLLGSGGAMEWGDENSPYGDNEAP
jgi:hypothetical protein